MYIYIFNIITNITRPPQNRKIWNLETWCKTLIHSPSSVSIARLTVLLRPFWSSSAEAWTSQVSWHGCEGRVTSDVAKGPRDPFRPPGEIGGWKDPKKAKRRWWFMDDFWIFIPCFLEKIRDIQLGWAIGRCFGWPFGRRLEIFKGTRASTSALADVRFLDGQSSKCNGLTKWPPI